MRRAAVIVVTAGLLAMAGPSFAEPPSSSSETATGERVENRVGKGASLEGPVAISQRKGKGSGFWTSDVPTPDRPYRWGYMAMGSVIMALMGGLVFFLVRRASRERDAERPAS